MITLDQTKMYLKTDDTYEDDLISGLIQTSATFIDSMVGIAYKADEKAIKLADLLQLKLVSDMYVQRGTSVTNSTKQDKIVTSILDKLSNY